MVPVVRRPVEPYAAGRRTTYACGQDTVDVPAHPPPPAHRPAALSAAPITPAPAPVRPPNASSTSARECLDHLLITGIASPRPCRYGGVAQPADPSGGAQVAMVWMARLRTRSPARLRRRRPGGPLLAGSTRR